MAASVGFRGDEPAYKAQLEQWHQDRVTSLKSENGWLNLAGLFWLKDGVNTVGGDTGNDLAFPTDKTPNQLGTFRLTNGSVQFEPAPEAVVLVSDPDGKPQPLLSSSVIFSPEMKKPVTLSHGSLRWFVIKRGDKYGVRLRDLEGEPLKSFHGIERYPVDEAWRVKARFEAPSAPRTIPIMDVLGMISQQPLAGTLVFELRGKTYRLDAVGESSSSGAQKLFIMFGDATNAHETYGSGRFLYADKPDGNNPVTLDFNQAINPPCAFTPYATCPLPPKQNKLALAVTAGERRYGDH